MNPQSLLIIGMSPGNGYFKQGIIDQLIPYGLTVSEKIGIFIPDIPAIATYIALGYPENIARREKAIPQGNSFRNRIKKTISEKQINPDTVIVFDWEQEGIENNPDYRKAFDYIQNLYTNNKDFQQDINSATETVLIANPFKKKGITREEVKIGTHYILSEFAFMLFVPNYLKNHNHFIYGYHHRWQVFENFIAGVYDGVKKENLEFLLLPYFK